MTSSYPSAPIAISRTPGEQTFPSITVPPCDGTNTSAAQQMQHAQQELSLQQKIRELAKHYQSRR
jgi:hypothetical protein